MNRHSYPGSLAERWRAAIARVDMSGGPFPIEFFINDQADCLRARVRVPDATGVAPVGPGITHEVMLTFSLTDGDFEPCVANLYRAARWLYVHELTEWFRVDGVPFVTAHRNGDTVHTSIDAPDGDRIEKPMFAGRP